MQHHAHQRPPRPLLAMRRALRRRPHQPRPLQRQPGHRVAELVIVPLHQLLVKMLHREARHSSPRTDPACAGSPRPPPAGSTACRSAGRASPPAPHRAAGRANAGTSAPRSPASPPLPLVQLAPLMAIEQSLKPHLPYSLQHLRPDHRPPPFRAVLKPDRSRATKTRQITSQLQFPAASLPANSCDVTIVVPAHGGLRRIGPPTKDARTFRHGHHGTGDRRTGAADTAPRSYTPALTPEQIESGKKTGTSAR